MEQSPFWEANKFPASQNLPPHFKEPEGSLPHLQQPATRLYSEPDQSSPCPLTQRLEDPFQYYFLIYAWIFQVVIFPSGFSTKTVYAPLFSHHTKKKKTRNHYRS